jgi:microcystin-dependent protein
MKRIILTSMLVAVFMLVPVKESVAGDNPYIGEITLFGGNFAPRGYAFCEGQLLPISQNTALFSLLGTTYGGDGRVTFALPNLKKAEKSLGGVRYIIALQGIYPSRS